MKPSRVSKIGAEQDLRGTCLTQESPPRLNLKEMDTAVVELIDRLERHKAAAQGISGLEIGTATVVNDFTDCIRMLHYLRAMRGNAE